MLHHGARSGRFEDDRRCRGRGPLLRTIYVQAAARLISLRCVLSVQQRGDSRDAEFESGPLKKGDILSIDTGVKLDGYYGRFGRDSASLAK